jgi:hypothetical protein
MEHANATVPMSATTHAGPMDWEANRERIVGLYLDHSVKQIKQIMEVGGFLARYCGCSLRNDPFVSNIAIQ